MRAPLAELLGTFWLTLAVGLSLVSPTPLPTPLIAALTVGLFVYLIGPLSGAHLNPAVTIGLWSAGSISIRTGVLYVIAQVLGSTLAAQLVAFVGGQSLSVGAENTLRVGLLEGIGAFLLVFTVSAVARGMIPAVASGVTIGTALLIGILVASVGANGVLNPAVAFGIGSFSPAYLFGPLLGGIVGARLSAWLIRSA